MSRYHNNWTKYLSEEKQATLINVPFSNLIIARSALKLSVEDCRSGRCNITYNPIEVMWVEKEGKYQLTDGYHRVVSNFLRGDDLVEAYVNEGGKEKFKWKIADKDNRFEFNSSLKYNGLENVIEEEILEELKKDLELA